MFSIKHKFIVKQSNCKFIHMQEVPRPRVVTNMNEIVKNKVSF